MHFDGIGERFEWMEFRRKVPKGTKTLNVQLQEITTSLASGFNFTAKAQISNPKFAEIEIEKKRKEND